ncbi:MAG: PorT family protein [Bacteroidota bacterium]|nr:PorT family protein [Bacteroidota bacterium]
MKRNDAKILCVIIGLITFHTAVFGQERLRIGFSTSPMISWIANNDNTIVRTGGNLGLKLGTSADIYFRDNYSITTGINLGFHEGGTLRYETGGNFLPKSDLSDEILKTGDKPLPDGVKITYSLQYVEIPFALKITSKDMGYLKYFIEAPMFSLGFLTRGRGDIETPNQTYEQENIYKDLAVFNVFWGFGAGMEYSISENNSLIGGLYFQNGLLDVIDNKGHTANNNPDLIPEYILEKEDSRASVSNLILRIGILF